MKTSPRTCFGPCLVLLIAAAGCLLAAETTQAQTHYELVILAGQSNARGAAGATNLNNLPANLQAPQQDVLFVSNDGGSLSGPTDLQPGSGVGDDGFGPEISFGRTVADARPNANFGIAKHALSATDLEVQWNPTGSIYSQMLNTVGRATNSITAANNTYEITGFIWVQGEADANRQQGATYNVNLTNFIAAVRSDFGADLPFFISQLSDNQVYGANAHDELVRQAQQDVAAADANTFLLDTDGPEFIVLGAPDNLHYTTEGQVVLGQALASSYLAATAGNAAPIAVEDSLTVLEGGTKDFLDSGEVTLQANDTDSEDGVPTGEVLLSDTPLNGTVTVNSDGTFEYVHNGSATTTDQFTYTVTDSAGAVSAPATVLVVITTVSSNTDVIIFQEDFSGAATSDLNGTTPAIAPTAGSWVSQATSISADGSALFAGNSLAAFAIGSVINDSKGTPDGLFELTATLDRPTAGGWYSIGFSQQATPATNNHFLSRDGIGTIILRTNGELDMWAGNGFTPNGLSPSGNSNAIDGPDGTVGTRTLTVELDLRNWNGTDDFGTVTYFDSGIEGAVGTFNYTNTPIIANTGELGSIPTDPDFNSIMLSANNNTVGVYSSLTLTQITSTSVLVGDVNMDGTVNFLDISPFISHLSTGEFKAEADIDGNGVVNFLDISPFIGILSGS